MALLLSFRKESIKEPFRKLNIDRHIEFIAINGKIFVLTSNAVSVIWQQ
jgi:hypothetical protein